MNVKSILVFLILLLTCLSADALGPHELLLLANEESEASVSLAQRYMALRHIPENNLVLVRVPPPSKDGVAISLDTFMKRILTPARQAVVDRGIDDHILAWVYSVDFPTRISTPEGVSILGATFLRGELPSSEAILRAEYSSPLFAGPERSRGDYSAPQTFEGAARLLGRDMPVPSMMLGFTGERGNSIEEVWSALGRGAASDATAPTGMIYFVTNDDVRSHCRAWQYSGAQGELRQLGVEAVVTNQLPVRRRDVAGLMMGSANVKPEEIGAFLPGALAEHLTSYGAAFERAGQTKISLWIKAGATLTAGAVVEPRAMYEKFPTARFYVYYARGCTAMESFYQAIKSPLQILMLGDPLASPWAPPDRVSIVGMPTESVAEPFTVSAKLERKDPMRFYSRNMWLLDGRLLGGGTEQTIDVSKLKQGAHTLRVVAYSSGMVRHQVFAVETFRVL